MSNSRSTVFIIDDEASIRTALERLCRSAGYAGSAYESVEAFLESEVDDRNACVVADIRMPGTSGLALPARLRESHRSIPVIFITAYDTPEARAEAHRVGGAAYYRKPVDDQALLDAVEWAITHSSPKNTAARNSRE